MAGRRHRAAGAILMILGLMVAVVGLVASPAAADEHNVVDICNNQQGDEQDCNEVHGTVAWSFAANGDLVFTFASDDEDFDGWKDLYVCVPGTPVTNGADCQGSSDTVLTPEDDYSIGGVEDETAGEHGYEGFDCDKDFTATVFADTIADLGLDDETVSWTIHVNTCDGGTDEAFGSSVRSETETVTHTYECDEPTDVGATSATLNGSTSDTDVESAEFTLNPGATALPGTAGDAGAFSAEATGLDDDTDYTYTVTFKSDDGTVLGTSDECEFATSAVPPPNQPVNNTVTQVTPEPEPATVLGVQVTREEAPAAAPAVEGAALAATGSSDVSATLVLFGIAMLVIGGTLVTSSRRLWVQPAGRHSLVASADDLLP